MSEPVLSLVQEILDKAGLELTVERSGQKETRTLIELSGPDEGLLQEEDVLEALQYVVNRVAHRRLDPDEGVLPVLLDCGGWRRQRELDLLEEARELAEEVSRTGEPVTFEGLTSYERRLVHMELAEDPSVETRSEGLGRHRVLSIHRA